MRKIAFTILALALLTACSSNKNELFENVEYETSIENKDLNIIFEFVGKLALPTDGFEKNVKNTLHNHIITTTLGSEYIDYSPRKALKVYADSSYAEYKKLYDEIFEYNPIEPTDTFHFATDIVGSVLYADSAIVSYQRMMYTYSAGAHGMTTVTNYVFDLETGKQLTEEDVFGKDFERKIHSKLIEKADLLRQESRLPEEDEFYNNNLIQPNGNFAMTDSSVIYTFNPYEIAPYCFGVINIEIEK